LYVLSFFDTKTKHESTTKKHIKRPIHILLKKTNLQWANDEEHHVKTEKNED